MISHAAADPSAADREACLFGHYLVGREPPSALARRYVEADRVLFTRDAGLPEQRVMAFILRHPRSLPFVDAAAGLLRPDSLLRRKVLVMAAILETSTPFVDEFLPGRTTLTALLAVLATAGFLWTMQLVMGIPLLWLAERAPLD